MIAYTIAKNGVTRVIITLEIPDDAQTNMARSSIAVPETANYRTNKAKVASIEDASGGSYTSATSFIFTGKTLTYTLGETLEVPGYDPNIEIIHGEGIHYFLSRRVAELYGLEMIEDGLFESWHDNGQKAEEATCVNWKYNGRFECWYENGQKWAETTYLDGEIHGQFQRWHPNGQKWEEITFVDGKRPHRYNGLRQSWYPNGQKELEETYVNGKLQGLCHIWNPDGTKREERPYMNGGLNGLYRLWNSNGKLLTETTYVDGIAVPI